MAFLAPAIAGAIGLTGTALTVGTALLNVAISAGLGFASQLLVGRERSGGSDGARGISLNLQTGTDVPRTVIMGEQATGGSLVFWTVSGASNRRLQLVIALADHECDGISKLYVNGIETALDASGNIAGYSGSNVRFYSGAAGQVADPDLIAASQGDWTANHIGVGVCYAIVDLNYIAEKFPSGIPSFRFVVRGAKLYDPRLDTTVGGAGNHRENDPSSWTFSRNPVLQWRAWHRGIFSNGVRVAGMNTPASMVPIDEVIAEANACEEQIALDGGGFEDRYRCDAVIETHRPHRDVLLEFLGAMAGDQIDSGGVLRVIAGVPQASVMAITDADLMVAGDVEIREKLPRTELINTIFGTYSNPDDAYNLTSIAPRISLADEAVDGGRLEHSYELDTVTSGSQAQRILEIKRRQARLQCRISFLGRARLASLEAGDWIVWTSERFGWINRTFKVVNAPLNHDLTVPLSLREITSTAYAWSVADENDRALPGNMPQNPPPFGVVTGHVLANVSYEGAPGVTRPGLYMTWPSIDDPTVDQLRIQYRKVGNTDALEVTVHDPAAGSHAWIDGVQGITQYEARLLPVTVPARSVQWSTWATSGNASAPHRVDEVETAPDPDPGSVGPTELTPQVRFELDLVGRADEYLANFGWTGEVEDRVLDGLLRDFDNRQRGREAEGRNVSLIKSVRQELFDKVGNAEALITSESVVRAGENEALAASIDQVSTTLNGVSTSVTQVQASVDGHSASWGIVIDQNGNTIGRVRLDGSDGTTTFGVVADAFTVALPGEAGGDPVPVFGLEEVDETVKLVLRGDMIADGGIAARTLDVSELSAIVADIGEVTAGLLRSDDNLMRIDLDAKEIIIETAPVV